MGLIVGENVANSGENQLLERQALIYNMLKANGEISAFIASEICTQDIKYLRKKHKRFAYIRKKQYFCRRKNGGCTQKNEKKSGKMDKNLRMWNNIRNFAE